MPEQTRRLGLVAFAALALAAPSPARARSQTMRADRVASRAEMEACQRMPRDLEKLKRDGPRRSPVARPDFNAVAEEFKQLQLVNYSLAGVADPRAALEQSGRAGRDLAGIISLSERILESAEELGRSLAKK